MKRGLFLFAVMTLVGLTSWAGVRLDLDSGNVGGGSPGQTSLEFDLHGGTGEIVSTVWLGDVGGVQTPSLLAVLSASPTSVMTAFPVTLDASESLPGDGEVVSYDWDLDGNGVFETTSTEASRTVSFDQDGTVPIRVRITNSAGETSTSEAIMLEVLNRAPNANFSAGDEALIEGSEIRFSDLSTDPDGTVVSWRWSFGDGATSIEANPTYVYERPGTYRVELTVTDDDGLDSERMSIEIEVLNLAPQAAFTMETRAARVGEPVLFRDESTDASPEGVIVHVAWNFGDGVYSAGGPASGGVYSHVYDRSGTYVVTLYVIDDAGAMASAELVVDVN